MKTLQEEIAELLAQAEPLRALDDDAAEEAGLPALVQKINALRALENPPPVVPTTPDTDPEAPPRRVGRPPKAR